MSKPSSILISILILISALTIIIPQDVEAASSPGRQEVDFYMFGPANDGNLSTENPTSDEDTQADCPDSGSKMGQQSTVGTWRSRSFTRGTTISGDVYFDVWAKTTEGTVSDVDFTCQISVNGDQDQQSFTTDQNDTHPSPELFSAHAFLESTPNSDTTLHVGTGDHIEIEITYNGRDNFLEDSGHTVILYESITHDSGIRFLLGGVTIDFAENSIIVNDENEAEDPSTVIVTTTLDYIMGLEDMVEFGFEAVTVDDEGELFEYEILEEEDDHITLEWKWRYADDYAASGTWELNVTCTDRSGNTWYQTQPLRIITQIQPRLDFVLTDTSIIATNTYEKKTGYINVTFACYGEEDIVGLIPYMIFKITTPQGVVDTIIRQPPIDSNSERIITIDYYFNNTGSYIVNVEINPRNTWSYWEANDQGTSEDNNVATVTITVITAPKKDDDQEWYEELQDDLENEVEYQAGLAAAVVVVILVVFLIVRRRREYEYEDDDEYEDDEYYE